MFIVVKKTFGYVFSKCIAKKVNRVGVNNSVCLFLRESLKFECQRKFILTSTGVKYLYIKLACDFRKGFIWDLYVCRER